MNLRHGFLSFVERVELAWEGLCLGAEAAWHGAKPLRAATARQWRRTTQRPLIWSFGYVALFCVVSMLWLDRPVARLFKAHIHGEVEGFFKVVTNLGMAEYYLVPSGLLFLVLMMGGRRAAAASTRARLRRWAVAPGFMFLTIAVSGIIGNIIKFCAGRYRPRYLFDQNLYGFDFFSHSWAMNSFPSGHSQAVFAAMTALVVIFPRYDLMWLLIAVLVAASRVVTTVHYLSDVVAGSWLAICVTVLLVRAFRARGWDPRLGAEY